MGPTPSIGYKNHATVRYARPDGTFEMVVHNEKELISASSMPGYCCKIRARPFRKEEGCTAEDSRREEDNSCEQGVILWE